MQRIPNRTLNTGDLVNIHTADVHITVTVILTLTVQSYLNDIHYTIFLRTELGTCLRNGAKKKILLLRNAYNTLLEKWIRTILLLSM